MRNASFLTLFALATQGCVSLQAYRDLEFQSNRKTQQVQQYARQIEQLQNEKAALEALLAGTRKESAEELELIRRALRQTEISGVSTISSLEDQVAERDSRILSLERQLEQERSIFGLKAKDHEGQLSEMQSKVLEAQEERTVVQKDFQSLHEKYMVLLDARAADSRFLNATKDNLSGKLSKWVTQGTVSMALDDEGLRISLFDAVSIEDDGKARVRVEAYDILFEVASLLLPHEKRLVYVIGHTDSVPIQSAHYPSNWELSVARAVEVVHYLQGQEKMDPKRLIASGCGPHRPIADNTTPEGRRRNRRVEILIPRICQ